MIGKCDICGEKTGKRFIRCDEHHRCDDCGTLDGLCYYCEGLLCDPCHTARVQRRIAEFAGDTGYTSEIVCPHCGYEMGDSCEMSEGEQECSDCGLSYDVTRDVEVTYSTVKVDK